MEFMGGRKIFFKAITIDAVERTDYYITISRIIDIVVAE